MLLVRTALPPRRVGRGFNRGKKIPPREARTSRASHPSEPPPLLLSSPSPLPPSPVSDIVTPRVPRRSTNPMAAAMSPTNTSISAASACPHQQRQRPRLLSPLGLARQFAICLHAEPRSVLRWRLRSLRRALRADGHHGRFVHRHEPGHRRQSLRFPRPRIRHTGPLALARSGRSFLCSSTRSTDPESLRLCEQQSARFHRSSRTGRRRRWQLHPGRLHGLRQCHPRPI